MNRVSELPGQPRSIAVVGGGFSGSLFALKLAMLRPNWTIFLVEESAHVGRGVAYGACGPQHLLNVPVSRMEVGLNPSFGEWLRARPGLLRDALAESDGRLGDAFVPRQLFGDYIEELVSNALSPLSGMRIRRVHGQVVSVKDRPRRIVLDNKAVLPVDSVVLATGNQPSRLPFKAAPSDRIVTDPWAPGALRQIGADDSVLLLGTGLTMVDMLIALRAGGHRAPIHAVSRHGLLPKSHHAGGSWPPFLNAPASPIEALRTIRYHVRLAIEQQVPWQRVFDAVRPSVASLWHGWSIGQRAQFLRHLRAIWDVHRHRMARRIAANIDELAQTGTLTVTAGRVLAVDERKDAITVMIRRRGKKALTIDVNTMINCTGPTSDLRHAQHPLLVDLLRQGLVDSDPLGIGVETVDCAAKGADGVASDWLFAIGPLTRPAWWEISAVPEITAQIDRLVRRLIQDKPGLLRSLPAIFLDIGAGI